MISIQLDKLEELAASLLSPGEIAILLGIPQAQRSSFCVRCRAHDGDPIYEAYNRGRLTTKLDLRRNIIKLAKAGSPAAEPMVEIFLREQNANI